MRFFKWFRPLLLVAALVGGLVWGYLQIQPPALIAQPDATPIVLEDATQAPDLRMMLSHIRAMAAVPHHVDSPGIRQTQGYLKQQIAQMGFAYEEESYQLTIDEILAIDRQRMAGGGKDFGTDEQSIREGGDMGNRDRMGLNNIIVKVDAPRTEETVVFVSHTDSVKYGPGAFDDIVAVAAMLEGLRQMQGVTPVRDLVFLFTDGEEQGLLGAAKYVEDHPEMRERTRLVANLEARGNSGGLLMFETSGNNLAAVRSFAQGADHPIGFSLAAAVYRIMKNDTDLSMFMTAGYPGLNFAVIDGVEVYHTAEDNYDSFSRASANHTLRTVSSLVQHYATQPSLNTQADQDAVFFPLTPGRLVVIPQLWSSLLGILAFVLFLTFLIWTLARKQLSGRAMLLAAGISRVVTTQNNNAQSMDDYLRMLRTGMDWVYALIMLAVYCALAFVLYWRGPRGDRDNLSTALGVLLLPAMLALITVFLFPSASYLFWLPVLLALLALVLKPALHTGIPQAVFAFLSLLLYVPVACLVFIALGPTNANLSLALCMIPLSMILGICLMDRKQAGHEL